MSDAQTPTETTETKAPSISHEDLRLLLDAEKLKRESAEKKASDLEANLKASQESFVSLKRTSDEEMKRTGKLIETAQAECAAAVSATKAMEKKLQETCDTSYQTYLVAWAESKIGKASIPKDKTNTPELIAVALAAFDVARGHLCDRKQFQGALLSKLAL